MTVLTGLVQRVAATLGRYRMLSPGDRVGVAVSGGADSVCLLHVLRELAPGPLTILHLDHQLRGEDSRRDAEFVAALACRLGLPIVSGQADLGGGNLEEAGRRARLDFFRATIASGAVDRVATGHTRSDQAETVLFRLLRGAADDGLSGIRPVTSGGLIRPLIEVERSDVREYLGERGVEWREDATNASLAFARNRIRHELLPLLQRDWNPEIVATLARTAEWAAAEGEYWNAELDRLEAAALTRDGDTVFMSAAALRALPVAAARRLIRRAIARAKGDLRSIGFVHVNSLLQLAHSERGTGSVHIPGVRIRRSQNWLRFDIFPVATPVMRAYRIPAPVPGFIPIPGAARGICLELIENSVNFAVRGNVYNVEMGCVDWDRVSGSLELRNWIPGDRFHPARSAGAKKLKTLFQSARIPQWERQCWPVLADGESIVWTRQFGVSAAFAAGPQTRSVLRISERTAE